MAQITLPSLSSTMAEQKWKICMLRDHIPQMDMFRFQRE
jgi:hypothetical protein